LTKFAESLVAALVLTGVSLTFVSSASAASEAAMNQSCRDQVHRIWPNVNTESGRTADYLHDACVYNGGRIPD
jgi:hypothetical protein